MRKIVVLKKALSAFLAIMMMVAIIPLGDIMAFAASMGYSTGLVTGINHKYDIDYYNNMVTDLDDKNSSNRNTILLHHVNGKNAYCIEPASNITSSTAENTTMVGYVNNVGHVYNETDEKLVKLIIAYGYHDEWYPTASNWDTASWSAKQAMYECFATQILIWEVVTGERDANMNHVPSKEYALQWISNGSGGYFSPIKGYYDSILSSVQNALRNANRGGTKEGTPQYPNVNLGEVELTLNTSNYCYEATIVNSNISGAILNNCDLPSKYISINGNTLKISIPIVEAIQYQNKSFSGLLTKTTQSSSSTNYPYLIPTNFKMYKGGQYMVVVGGAVESSNTETTITKSYWSLNFKLKVPYVHRHLWVPHKINPTCTTQGLMCWECSCGKVITANYDFVSGSAPFVDKAGSIDPSKYDFKTGIVAAEGHDQGVWITTVEATCTTAGEQNLVCTKCGVVIGSREIPAKGHTSDAESVKIQTVAPSRTSNGEYQLCCARCGVAQKTEVISKHTHDSNGGVVTIVAPTCIHSGVKGTICGTCGVIWQTEVVEPGHSGETVTITSIPATCTENGEEQIICTSCGKILSTKVIEKLGHTEDDVWYTNIEASCVEDGEMSKFCTRCANTIETKVIPAIGHDDGVWTVAIEPTCEFDGEKVLTCTRCGKISDSEAIEKLGHDDGYWGIDVEATPDHDGIMSLYCSRCGILKESKDFTLHTHEKGYESTIIQANCTNNGQKGTVCKICNAIFETEIVEATGHKYNAPYTNGDGTHSEKCSVCGYENVVNCSIESVVKKNDCSNIGYTTNTCEICSYNYVSDVTDAWGHSYSKWEEHNNVSHVRYCKNCPVAEYTLHQYGEFVFDQNAKGEDPGTNTRTCIYCAKKETVKAKDTIITIINKDVNKTMTFMDRVADLINKVTEVLKKIAKIFNFFGI